MASFNAARGGGLEFAKQERNRNHDDGNKNCELDLWRYAKMGHGGAEKPGAEKADAPEGMRAVHDAALDQGFRPVRFDIQDNFDAADEKAYGYKQGEE